METKSDKNDDKKPSSGSVFGFFSVLANAVNWEVHSWAGRTNMIVDFLLAGIIVVYIMNNGATTIVKTIASIFNPDLTAETGDNIMSLLAVFLVASVICLFIMAFARQETEELRKHNEDNSPQSGDTV